MTEQDVTSAISTIPDLSQEQLVHYYKCALSRQSTSEKRLLKPLITAIEKQLKTFRKIADTPSTNLDDKLPEDIT